MYLVAIIVVIDLFIVICYCISYAKSKAVNQSKDRLETEAKDKAIANRWNNAGTKIYANDAWWVVEDVQNEEMM